MKTAIVDAKRRIRIPDLKPGQILAYENREGIVTLTPLKPIELPPVRCKLVKENGFTVVQTNRPIDEKALKEALSEFP